MKTITLRTEAFICSYHGTVMLHLELHFLHLISGVGKHVGACCVNLIQQYSYWDAVSRLLTGPHAGSFFDVTRTQEASKSAVYE